MKMNSGDFSVTSAVPVWLGDRAVECHVLLEPGQFSVFKVFKLLKM